MSVDPAQQAQPPNGNSQSEVPSAGVRPSKIVGLTQSKQNIRMAKSGEIRDRLHTQNTKLRHNVDTLSLISLPQNYKKALKQLQVQSQKLQKYKSKLKQKDTIILRLLDRIQRSEQGLSKSTGEQVALRHTHFIHSLKGQQGQGQGQGQQGQGGGIGQGQRVLQMYQGLLGDFVLRGRELFGLRADNQGLRREVKELETKIKDNEQEFKRDSQQMKEKLDLAHQLLKKETDIRKKLLDSQISLVLSPQIKKEIQEVEMQGRVFQNGIVSQESKAAGLVSDVFSTQSKQTPQTINKRYEQQYCSLLQKFKRESQTLMSLNIRISQIQSIVSRATSSQNNSLQKLQDQLQQLQTHKTNVQKIQNNFQQSLEQFNLFSLQWSDIEKKYMQKQEQNQKQIRTLEELLQKYESKYRIFQLKILSFDESNGIKINLQDLDINQYINERLDHYFEEIGQLKNQNRFLSSELNIYKKQLQEYQKLPLYQGSRQSIDLPITNLKQQKRQILCLQEKVREEVQKWSKQQLVQNYLKSTNKISNLEQTTLDLKLKLQSLRSQNPTIQPKPPSQNPSIPTHQQNSHKFQVQQGEQGGTQGQEKNQGRREIQGGQGQRGQGGQRGQEIMGKEGEVKDGQGTEGGQRQGDVDEQVFRNINDEMDRLIKGNNKLKEQLDALTQDYENRLKMEEKLNEQIKEKLRESQEINSNLSNIVVHLEGELSRYQNNLDISAQEQIGSQNHSLEGSVKLSDDQRMYYSNNIQKLTEEINGKKKQFEDLLKSGDYDEHSSSKQIALKEIELDIRQLQNKLQQETIKSKQKIQSKDSQLQEYCESLSKINAQLIKKIQRFEEEKRQKEEQLQQQINNINRYPLGEQNSLQNMKSQYNKLRQVLITKQIDQKYSVNNLDKLQKQISRLKQINQDLIESISQKQKLILRLRSQSYRQRQDSDPKVQEIVCEYENRIEYLEQVIKNQQKSESNLNDLYETITYLNDQCEILRKTAQKPQNPHSEKPTLNPNNPNISNNYFEQIDTLLKNNGCLSVRELEEKIQILRVRGQEGLEKSRRCQEKIGRLVQENQFNFGKLNQGKAYQILQNKSKQIDQLSNQNQAYREEIAKLQQEKDKFYQQNERISRDLKAIQEAVRKLTGDKGFSESTFNSDQTLSLKVIQPSKLSQITQREDEEHNEQTNVLNLFVQSINEKLGNFKKILLETPFKNKVTLSIPKIDELPTVEEILILLNDRLNFTWGLAEERTNQYNELRDEMNIISLQCMKVAKIVPDSNVEKSEQNSLSREQDSNRQIVEERYEQILAQLLQYQTENKRLENEISKLKNQLLAYKRQVEDIQAKCVIEVKSQSSQDNLYDQNLLNRILQGRTFEETSKQTTPDVVKLFLNRMKELQSNLENIEVQFEQKNRRLESLIQKQRSFVSDRSGRNADESLNSQKAKKWTDQQAGDLKQKQKVLSKLIITPTLMDEKSYSLNSAKVFKQIEQLTRNNQELKQKKHRMKSILENAHKVMDSFINKYGSTMDQTYKKDMMACLHIISQQCQQDSKKDNSGFDIEGDLILSSSFSQKIKGNAKMEHQDLEDIKNTLEGNDKPTQKPIKSEKKLSQKANPQFNMKFLEENKFLVQELVQKANQLTSTALDIENVKELMSKNMNDKELQEILYLNDSTEAINKIISLFPEAEQVSNQRNKKIQDNNKQNEEEQSIEQGEWVQTEQLQQIINEIYPNKTELCILVANSINMLMLAQKKQQILNSITHLFSNLKQRQNVFESEIKRRERVVSDYGQKLQKILMQKFSEQQSERSSSLLNENSLRKSLQMKSQYRQGKVDSNSHSNSHSHSGSAIAKD